MRLDIRSRFTVTPALEAYVARRVRFALGRFAARLRRVDVRLDDVNGPRGGVDKRCRLQVALRGRPVVVEEVDRDLYAAVDRATERAGRAAERALERLRAA